MFDRLSRGITRHPWAFVIAWLMVLAVAAAGTFWGFGQGGLFERLKNSESMVQGSEADRVATEVAGGDQGENVTLVIKGLDLKDQMQVMELMKFQTEHRDDLKVEGVETVMDAFMFPDLQQDPRAQALLSAEADGYVTVITMDHNLNDDEEKATHERLDGAINTFTAELRDVVDDAEVYTLSTKIIGDEIIGQVQNDLVRGEAIGLPVALLLLVIVFGGLLAAGLPLIGAIISIVAGMAALWGMTFVMGIDSFLLNVISIIGLALSIDYGLLVVSRYREEASERLAEAGYDAKNRHLPGRRETKSIVREAARSTILTAGRTVSFSALTIAFSLTGLLIMQSSILKTVALGGIIVTLLAVFTAVTLVPAIIVLLGVHMLKPSVLSRIPGLRKVASGVGDVATDHGFFSKLAAWVHRHPFMVMLVITVILGVMASPLGNLRLRSNMVEYMPKGSSVEQAYNTLQDDYLALATPTITVIADAPAQETADLVTYLQEMDDVTYVSMPTPSPEDDNRTVISLRADLDDQVGDRATEMVEEIRAHDAGYEVLVGGPAALQLDFKESIIDDAPKAAGIIITAVFVLLFLMTGSLIVPIKALIINVFSLAASLGATVWIFEFGHFGMPKVHGLEAFIVVCMAAFGFGLAMDYEVFLLARIKEYWDAGFSNDEAVERGLQRSGRIITSAAAIIIAVFLGFVAGDMLAIKQIGVALAITVVTDATLVRMLLVPATMTVLGKWNWWAPKPLKAIYRKFKIVH